MIPGEIKVKSTEIEINKHHPETVIEVKNTGDRPIQVGSHFHFFEANKALALDIPAGAAVRFEPGDEKEVQLVEYAGHRKIFGFRGLVNGDIDEERVYRPTGKNDENAGIFGDEGEQNANKKGGKQ